MLSLTALATVVVGLTQPLQPDEGTPAHIFQWSVAGLMPIGVLFLATADWRQPWRSLRLLACAGLVTVFSFAALYYLEHLR
jgi:hypothetical protein